MQGFSNVDGVDGPPAPSLLHELIERQTQAVADQTAIVFGEQRITYRQLNARAEQLSWAILQQDPGADLIGVSSTRSLDMVVSVLAILKAGKAYLPLDPESPRQRLQQIVTDAQLTTCLAGPEEHILFENAGLRVIDPAVEHAVTWQPVVRQNPVAYVIYTSGSTGVPKGVLVEHRSALTYLQSSVEAYSTDESGNAGSFVHLSLTFDASVTALFVPLLTGKLMVISSRPSLDVFNDENLVRYAPFDFIKLTPSQFYLLDTATDERAKQATHQYVVGGSALHLQHIQFLVDNRISADVINEYGPTETTVGCIWYRFNTLALDDVLSLPTGLLIGRPMPSVSIYILDKAGQPVETSTEGEIYIGGIQVAGGYLNRPELTAERFLSDPFMPDSLYRMYRSGDLARWHADGNIEYLGRADEQVKIGGYRIELGEIESVLQQHAGVRQGVVLARDDSSGNKRLIGYVVPQGAFDRAGILEHLRSILPDYMVPRLLVEMDSIPLTSNGKLAKDKLPVPDASEALTSTYTAPTTRTETKLSAIWQTVLGVRKVGLSDNFFELGGNSLLAIKTVATLKQQGYQLPVTKLYQYPTVGGLAAYLDGRKTQSITDRPKKASGLGTGDVAVIGMAGRFPGANSVDELWTVLTEGRETISFFQPSELDASLPADLIDNPDYVGARGILDGADHFDAAFFGLNPKLAEAMDPQQRIFLEIAWEVLEQTGYLPAQYNGLVGVYAGSGNNTYYLNNVHPNQRVVNQIGSFQVQSVNEKDYIASRTAYQLNLKGPAVSVYSACSTSLLAIAQAVESIRTGQCDVALAGGSSVTAPINSGHLYEEGAILSRDGHCRSFDAEATGTVFSDGAGVVLLKSLEAARRDGDTIYAVIKGTGVNNDGGGKGSFTAPNAEGQAAAIRMAINDAQVHPSTIGYVEAHGTATPLGDPIEIEGLTMAFGEVPVDSRCALGSIKSNMGHLTAAAGVAGFIKTTLTLHHRQLPASLGFDRPNPAIDFTQTPFYVNTSLTDWASAGTRRAGVSSFGVGGTNVHVVLEEYVNPEPIQAGPIQAGPIQAGPVPTESRPADEPSVQLITWSAQSVESRDAYAGRLVERLGVAGDPSVADIAFTLQTTRANFAHRRFVLATDAGDLREKLTTGLRGTAASRETGATPPSDVVFLFPGQGAQYLDMGRALYENEPVFRQAIDDCAVQLTEHLQTDIRDIIYPAVADSLAEQRLRNTRYTQPALFVTGYALARLWMSWGIQPTVFCGHSVGEFVAAHLAGVFTLPDALKLIACRGRMVSELPRGSMLSVRMEADQVQALMPLTLSMAAINSRKLCVVAGPDEHIADFARLLDEKEIPNRLLLTSHAFHSAMMDPIVGAFTDVVSAIPLQRPQKPIISTTTGTWLTDAEATDPRYWAHHLRATVRFADALDTLLALDSPLLFDVGPGQVSATLARQQLKGKTVPILTGLTNDQEWQTLRPALLTTLGQLYLNGLEPDWTALYANQSRKKISLPTTVFRRKRCWIDPLVVREVTNTTLKTSDRLHEYLPQTLPTPLIMRKDALITKIRDLLEDASGIDMEGVTPTMSFLEIGLDSLLLTQVAVTLKKEFGLPITFRQLSKEYATPDLLAAYLDKSLPAEAYQPAAPAVAPTPVAAPVPPAPVMHEPVMPAPVAHYVSAPIPQADTALGLIAQQLQLLAKQVALMQGSVPAVAPPALVHTPVSNSHVSHIGTNGHAPARPATNGTTPVPAKPSTNDKNTVSQPTADLSAEEQAELKKPFGATARIERQKSELSTRQIDFLAQLTQRYNQKTGRSKAYAQEHRAHMADPRVVSGFRPLTKEIVYPLVVNRSKGSRLWDIDGNEYIDVLNGFGSNMFGYQPDMIKQALHDQIERGIEVGPQHELAGEVSQLICEMTNSERAALCNTGSEAVLGAMRVARTITGRSLIVAFSGSYHGIVDEVIVRGTKKLKSFPAASGIMPEAVQNMLILDYGTDESLAIIRERAHELAAVLVEPVQSRRPEFVPIDFLKQVRTITAESGTALIFDEVISGFRMHLGGAQALFGIKADLATYGKVVGAGISIGVIAGKRNFMDALDGGFWQYGDDSVPEIGVTYFAGTFVRHPLALAAAKASLQYIRDNSPRLQQELTQKARRLADALNDAFTQRNVPAFVAQFGSLWKIKFKEELPYNELLFTLMREKGIHVWDGFPCFMTEAHTTDELEMVLRLFIESIDELLDAGFLGGQANPAAPSMSNGSINGVANRPPAPGARLGRDQAGNPAWFMPNPDQPGKYLQVKAN